MHSISSVEQLRVQFETITSLELNTPELREGFHDLLDRLKISREQALSLYLDGKSWEIQNQVWYPHVSEQTIEGLQGWINDISAFGIGIPAEASKKLAPLLEASIKDGLKSGIRDIAGLEGLIKTAKTALPGKFFERLEEYEAEGDLDVVASYVNSRRAGEKVLQSVRRLKEKDKFDETLESKLRTAASDTLSTFNEQDSIRILSGLGWSDSMPEVYGALVVGIASHYGLRAIHYLRELEDLDPQNRIPSHLAAIMARQVAQKDEFIFPNKNKNETLSFLSDRTSQETPTSEMRDVLREIILSRLQERPRIGYGSFYIFLEEQKEQKYRLSAKQAADLLAFYKSQFGKLDEPSLEAKANPLIVAALNSGNWQDAFSLALEVYGSTERINVAPFNERVSSIPMKRVMALNRRSTMDLDERVGDLTRISLELHGLQKRFGARLKYSITDEIRGVAPAVPMGYIETAFYFCCLINCFTNLEGKPASSLSLPNINGIRRGVTNAYQRLKNWHLRLGYELNDLVYAEIQRGYKSLFGTDIRADIGASRNEIARATTRQHTERSPPTPKIDIPPRVVVYFGGKKFPSNYQEAKAAIQSLGLEPRFSELFDGKKYHGAEAQSYDALAQLMGSVGVVVIEYTGNPSRIDRGLLGRANLEVREQSVGVLIYNKVRVIPLAAHQINAVKKALPG